MPDIIIDTAFETAQIALVDNARITARAQTQSGGAHDRVLAGMVSEMIAGKKIDKIIVTTGPGRFTGLRVGIAFARGFALTQKIPLVGVNTADAIAYDLKAKHPNGKLAVLIGVKRGQSFMRLVGETEIRVVEDDVLAAELACHAPLVVGGILSEAAKALFPISGVALDETVTEPSLEAILTVAPAASDENPVVRPYYAA
jgi:tRNA threonylcarbamoyladenosine biosynthesis protein TsaB